jgi:hypothetical protein
MLEARDEHWVLGRTTEDTGRMERRDDGCPDAREQFPVTLVSGSRRRSAVAMTFVVLARPEGVGRARTTGSIEGREELVEALRAVTWTRRSRIIVSQTDFSRLSS